MIPFRADTMSPFARAHSSTKQTSASRARSRITGPDAGEPISSSGFATNTTRSKGSIAPAGEDSASARRASRP